MTSGERAVLTLFDRCLAPDWEIYIQPHINGLRPDFVLLNPGVGIAVFEVKDWNLGAMRYFTKADAWGNPALWAEKDGEKFCIQKDNPITKVDLYKQEIYDLYCPRIGNNTSYGKHDGWAAITAGVIFPFADAAHVRRLLEPFLSIQEDEDYARYQPISGRGEIAASDIRRVFPESGRKQSKLMTKALADDLRGWLVEPDFSATQREPLTLDRNQRALADTRTESGYRRIKGPAGSGKSLVLAARAAKLMNEGKSVLVATFNITLWHYLRDLMVRGLDDPGRIHNVRLTHFHLWCKHVCNEVGWNKRYEALIKRANMSGDVQDLLNKHLPALAEQAVIQPEATKYDAILVDEGQDYRPHWWNTLRKACKPGGEMLLIADATQDVYGTATAWTDDVMQGAGFSGGRWARLKVSYRLPPLALDMARTFAQLFLPNETLDLPEQEQGSLDLYPCTLRWVQCVPHEASKVCVDEILALMKLTGKNGLANADITLLTDETKFGAEVTESLENQYRIRTVNTFGPDKIEQRRQKMGFYMGDARIKATTLHSFKGWEARLLVVYIAQATDPKALALLYAGLTRLKRSTNGSWLTVVCAAQELEAFGRTWSSFND
ncbi:DNA helicase [Azotobacter chroococcum]|nr:DNA helicase [Azotobacter chroococcum]